jgi:putative nucleotidyltransferase with HDIG domain
VQVLAEDAHRLDSARLHRSMEGVVRALSFAVEVRDPYTSAHQRRVGALAGAISRELGYEQEQVIQIQVAGLLHDVGKISVPSEIMTRPGKLTTAEMAIIRTHPEIGFNMLRGIEFDSPVALVALQHHERLDGSGYPQGLRDNEIIKESRIMAVADVVEAMASHRPYRPALGIEPALDEILGNRARLYDADCVDACFRVFTKCSFDFDQLLLNEPILYPSS